MYVVNIFLYFKVKKISPENKRKFSPNHTDTSPLPLRHDSCLHAGGQFNPNCMKTMDKERMSHQAVLGES